MRHREFARPDLAGTAVDLDLGYHGDAGAVALGISNTAAGYFVARLVTARRRPRVPVGFLRSRFDNGDIAGFLDVTKAEFDRIGVHCRRYLIDKGLAGEVDLRSDRIA